ncbi:hypothetical protein [uncultured Brevundimonas sp.]|uniref:hypothetical protein n=1 Tax=uncultured Brevundimonas sp. TaxID=213418 RepID=UPI0025F54190|nr:hypothetical protein [uncultured Brevundimonas sp.]
MTTIKTASIRTLALAGSALLLSSGVALAQTPYSSTQSQQQPSQQQEAIGAILGALFGDRLGVSTSVDAQWAAGRRPLNTQRTQFNTRVDADVRSGRLSSSTGTRIKADYDALVQLETRYAADGRFTTGERTELNDRYGALTQALADGGFGDDQGSGTGYASVSGGRAEFEARVDTAVRNRRITRTEGTRLKADYQALIQVEAGYLRDGSLSTRERDDLESRLDALDARVGDVGYGGGSTAPLDNRTRLANIERALSANASAIGRTEAADIAVEHGDLVRLEAAYARSQPSSDDRAYLDRRIGELELRARIRR